MTRSEISARLDSDYADLDANKDGKVTSAEISQRLVKSANAKIELMKKERDAAFARLDGDGNGAGGDDFILVGTPANGLFRLFGDGDGNGVVNAADFAAFRTAFGTGSLAFDFENNGSVGATDFAAFRARFGSSV